MGTKFGKWHDANILWKFSFICIYKDICKEGFFQTGNGLVVECSDVDECSTESNNCHINALCTNVIGSFTCSCKPNYVGDGVDICSVEKGISIVLI